MDYIEVKKQFNAPVSQVFELLSKHSTYNTDMDQSNLCKKKLHCLKKISVLNIRLLKIL